MSEKYNNIFYKNGKGIQSRFREKWVRENAPELAEVIENSHFYINNLYDFITILHIFLNGNIDDTPICPICNKSHYKWKKQKKEWSKYCSMKCCQNDPEVKTKMLEGQKGVDWDSVIKHRETTMLETYGVAAYSQLESAKEALSIRSSEYWKDKEHIESAKIIRAATNLENYGVEHLSMDKEYHTKRVLKAVDTKQNKSEEEKLIIIDKIRKSKMEEVFHLISDFDWINQKYNIEKMRIAQLVDILGVSWDAIKYALHRHGIQIDNDRENDNRSYMEIELFEFIKSLIDAKHSFKIERKEMDIFIPSLNLGIEFNGIYWHSELKKDKNAHVEKLKLCNDNGYRLIQIWEDDWENKRHVVESFFRNMLSSNNIRIGANKTKVVELDQEEFSTFLNNNHFLGGRNCKIRIGLMYSDNIVAVMGFNEIPKNEILYGGYSLDRFSNTCITGAFGKILSYFEKTYSPNLIRTFADLEIVDKNNNVYSNNGFIEDAILDPDYKYYNRATKRREDKRKWRNNILTEYGADGEKEREMAANLGLIRCYDSGKIRYIKKY